MKNFFQALLFLPILLDAQTIGDCRSRYVNYLNFHGSLNQSVIFSTNSIQIKSTLCSTTLFENELPAMGQVLKGLSTDQQLKLLKWKKNKHLSAKQLDSLLSVANPRSQTPQGSFKGLRVAIEPGHFCASVEDANIEQKYLAFKTPKGDSIALYESELTYMTATLLKSKLDQQGATVFLTRKGKEFTSTGYTYSQLTGNKRKWFLDSLVTHQAISSVRALALLKLNPTAFYKDFFRDFELSNRAKLINAFQPDLTVIIHYNVDEKNAPWKQQTYKDFTMTFVPGAMTRSDLDKTEGYVNFIRLLITNDLNDSSELAACTVNAFSKKLKIPIAKPTDATYLAENCVQTPKTGVYSRNLALCRKISGPLIYGEALYQDNVNESYALMARDTSIGGINVSKRAASVAESYYLAIGTFIGIH